MLSLDDIRPKEIITPKALAIIPMTASILAMSGDNRIGGPLDQTLAIKDVIVHDIMDENGDSMKGFAYNCVPTGNGDYLILKVYRFEESEKAYELSKVKKEAVIPDTLVVAHFMISMKDGSVQTASEWSLLKWALIVSFVQRRGGEDVLP